MKRKFSILLVILLCLSLVTLLLCLSLVSCGGKNKDWQLQYDTGVRCLSEGNYDQAVIAFDAAIQIDPRQEEAYIKAAEVHVALGEPQLAADVLTQAFTAIGSTSELRDAWENLLGDQYPIPSVDANNKASDKSEDKTDDNSNAGAGAKPKKPGIFSRAKLYITDFFEEKTGEIIEHYRTMLEDYFAQADSFNIWDWLCQLLLYLWQLLSQHL